MEGGCGLVGLCRGVSFVSNMAQEAEQKCDGLFVFLF